MKLKFVNDLQVEVVVTKNVKHSTETIKTVSLVVMLPCQFESSTLNSHLYDDNTKFMGEYLGPMWGKMSTSRFFRVITVNFKASTYCKAYTKAFMYFIDEYMGYMLSYSTKHQTYQEAVSLSEVFEKFCKELSDQF